uniref:Uncharacterized protein n=1 Tax=Syphacia muris TaxID=451379 RepID=A0A0N5AFC7_9BILA
MIGIINMPPESPAEFYEQRPLHDGETIIFKERKRNKIPEYFFAPDGRRFDLQSVSAETLWEETLQRSIICRLTKDDSARQRSTSCTNVTLISDSAINGCQSTIVTAKNHRQSSTYNSDECIVNTGDGSTNRGTSLPLFKYKCGERGGRKVSSSLIRARKFFSLSLPKITHS